MTTIEIADEFGWLIEHADSPVSAPVYWAGMTWTTDHVKAVRFCRKQDAEEVLLVVHTWYEGEPPAHRICEHGWSS